jgi:hypothetical protein
MSENKEIEKPPILDLPYDAASVALPNCLVKNLHVRSMKIVKPPILDLHENSKTTDSRLTIRSDQITEAAEV